MSQRTFEIQQLNQAMFLHGAIYLDLDFHRDLNNASNCMCEFDKYMRIINGEGRPKQLYPGKE